MVDINTKGVNDAFEKLSTAALQNADSDGNCVVNANDLSTVLMAFTLAKRSSELSKGAGKDSDNLVGQTLSDLMAKI